MLLLPFILLMALLFASVINVLSQSLGYIPAFGLNSFTLDYYRELIRQPTFLSALWMSLRIAFISAVIASILGVLLCAALTAHKSNRAALQIVRLPILVPHAVVAVFIINIFSQTGLLARLAYALGFIGDYTEFPQLLYAPGGLGIIIAYLWKEIPFIAYFSLSLMSSISSTLGEAAENLGASPIRSFFAITLPLSLPAVLHGFLIVFIFAFGGYELPFILGSTLPKALPVQAHIEFIHPDLLRRPYAMAMNGIILLLSVTMAILYQRLTKRLLGYKGAKR